MNAPVNVRDFVRREREFLLSGVDHNPQKQHQLGWRGILTGFGGEAGELQYV